MPPWATGCHLFATPGNLLAIFYCFFIFVAKERSPKILVEINVTYKVAVNATSCFFYPNIYVYEI